MRKNKSRESTCPTLIVYFFLCLSRKCSEEVCLTWPYMMSRSSTGGQWTFQTEEFKGAEIQVTTECNEVKPLERPRPVILLRE